MDSNPVGAQQAKRNEPREAKAGFWFLSAQRFRAQGGSSTPRYTDDRARNGCAEKTKSMRCNVMSKIDFGVRRTTVIEQALVVARDYPIAWKRKTERSGLANTTSTIQDLKANS